MKSLKINGEAFKVSEINPQILRLQPFNKKLQLSVIGSQIQSHPSKCIVDVIASSHDIHIFYKGELDKMFLVIKEIEFKKAKPRQWTVPVCFESSPDLSALCVSKEIDVDTYIKEIEASSLSVEMFGFMPGFVYIQGLKKKLQHPRKQAPLYNQKPNVLAVGGPYLGIYSLPSPSGWHIIGDIPCEIFSKNIQRPIIFEAGDILKIQSIDRAQFDDLSKQEKALTWE